LSRTPPGFEYRVSLGQNFLFDEALQNRLVEAAGVGLSDTVLEIGAGRGDLTLALAKRCRQVVTLEIDPRLEPVLLDRFSGVSNVVLHMADAMEADFSALMANYGPFHVVANLPYNLTTPLLNRFFRESLPILGVSVMIQREAAGRVLAAPGTPEYGPLAVLAAYRAMPREAVRVPARLFTPPPKVDGAFLVMPFHERPPVRVEDEALFFRLLGVAFAMRRKTLANNLAAGFSIPRERALAMMLSAGLPADVRGERLRLEDFVSLSNLLSKDLKL